MLHLIIRRALRLLAVVGIGFASCTPAAASHLVTGNGFGFAVVAPESGAPRPTSIPIPTAFTRPDPANPLGRRDRDGQLHQVTKLGRARARAASADYVADSHVVRLRRADGSGTIFMPFGFERPALIIAKTSAHGMARRMEPSAPFTQGRGRRCQLLRFDGIEEPLLLIPLAVVRKARPNQPLAASAAWALIAIENEPRHRCSHSRFQPLALRAASRGIGAARTRPSRTLAHQAGGAVQERRERHLWRQSETMLRMAQSREPNRPGRYGNGLIVAALPDVFSTPWVRDMAWATAALARMGHQAEARAALLAYFNARPTGKMREQVNGADYQISVVRYFGDGAEEPFFTQEGSTNIEFDNWGEVLWVLGEYLRKYDDPGLLKSATHRGRCTRALATSSSDHCSPTPSNSATGDRRRRYVDLGGAAEGQEALCFLDRAGDRRPQGVRGRGGASGRRSRAPSDAPALALLEKGFAAAFIRGGKLRGTLEEGVKNDIDGALIPIINFGLVWDPKLIRDTVNRMELLKVASGGYRRVRSTYTDPAIFEYWYERQEFLFVDFSLAELYRRLGRTAESEAMLKRIVDKAAADHNIIPEMYVALPCKLFPGKIGDPTSAMPMVGYGAGAYVLNLLQREH